MQLQRLNSLLLISLTLIAIFGSFSSFILSTLLTSDLITISQNNSQKEFLLAFTDPINKLNAIKLINITTAIALTLIPIVFLSIRNSQLFILENKKVNFQDAKEILKQHPHIVWTELFNVGS